MKSFLSISPEVLQALEQNRPVVALESSFLTHSMPYPDNLAIAHRLEAVTREEGAVPAFLAVMDKQLKVGLSEEDLITLCQEKAVKVSRRDLPIALSTGQLGATTVASAMIIAHMAGIRLFATGGIGGVHKGAQQSFDISADLQELAHTPVAVVCAGAKSILDIGLTLEYLETMGVPVLGYQTSEFPSFYSTKSGYPVDYNAETVAQIAAVLTAQWEVGLSGGTVIVNPLPAEYALDFSEIEKIAHAAMESANRAGVHGKKLTPYLSNYIKNQTGGASMQIREQLGYHNARIAAKIAVALAAV